MKLGLLEYSCRLLQRSFYCCLLMPLLLIAGGVEDAKTYHNNSTLQWRIAMDTINAVTWSGTEDLLDVGCGDGKITALLAQKLSQGSVLGMDISEPMIDFALQHYPKSEYPNLRFEKLGAEELFFENQFDRVVSFSTLHWVIDQEKALKAIYRALRPEGTLCIQTYGTGLMNVTVIADALVHTKKWADYFLGYKKQRVFFTETEYQALLERVGFTQVSVQGSWHDTPFANRQALIHFAKPLLNFIGHLPIELQEEFTEDVVDTIIAIAGIAEDGVIHYKTFSLQAFGVK